MRPVPNIMPSCDPGTVRLALIGEAVGADEVAQGIPFCGKSGWLLNSWLASAGLSRSQCFVGNVSQMRPSPTSNEFHLFEWHGPQVQEGIAALREDLARFRPNCVVALGNAALHLLRHGNVAPPKSKKLGLFQWTSHVGTWRGSLFEGARSFDSFEAAELRFRESQRGLENELLAASSNVNAGYPNRASQQVSKTEVASLDVGASPTAAIFLGEAQRSGSCMVAPPVCDGRGLPPLLVDCGATVNSALSNKSPRPGSTIPPSLQAAPVAGWSLPQVGATPTAACNPFKCLATYHPAATFRDPSFTYPLVSDLKRAVQEARCAELNLPPRRIVWSLSADEIELRCAAIRSARTPVGFDIEGGLGGLQCCSFATTPLDCFVIDLMDPTLERARIYHAIAGVLEDPLVPKVAWNAAYERAILQATSSITLKGYEDGMLAWWERFSELPKGLDFVASLLTREPYWAEGIGWDRKTGAPKVTGPRFWRYNGIDSCVTLEIWQHAIIRNVVESRSPVAFAL